MSSATRKLLDMKFINIYNVRHKKYVVSEPTKFNLKCDRDNAVLWEQFKVEQCPSDPSAILLQSVHGKYVKVNGPTDVLCNEDDPKEATPIYPIITLDNKVLFKMNNMYFSAQRNGSVEWNRTKAFGFETFIVTKKEVCERFCFRNFEGKHFKMSTDSNVVKCTAKEMYSSGLFDVVKSNGKAIISFVMCKMIQGTKYIDYLGVDSAGNVIFETNPTTPIKFGFVMLDARTVALRAPNGKFVSSGPDGSLKASAGSIGESEVFTVKRICF